MARVLRCGLSLNYGNSRVLSNSASVIYARAKGDLIDAE